jgi:hypothetical protein
MAMSIADVLNDQHFEFRGGRPRRLRQAPLEDESTAPEPAGDRQTRPL